MNWKFGLFSIALFFLFSCSTITELNSFKQTLEKKYGLETIDIAIDHEHLVVSMFNASYKDSADDVKQRIATEIGQLALQALPSLKITKGEVNFDKKKGMPGTITQPTKTFDMGIKP